MQPAFFLRAVSFEPRPRALVLDRVTLELPPYGALSLLGPSGAGKTTLTRVLLGLEAPTAGDLFLHGEFASSAGRVVIPPHRRAMAAVFQDLALWPHLTVHGHVDFALRAKSLSRRERRDEVRGVLAKLGLSSVEDRLPGDLSGGERQRLALARALAPKPSLLVLDEPFTSLDPELRAGLVDLVASLVAEQQTALVLVTHERNEAVRLTTTAARIEKGKLVAQGPTGEMFA